jgi:hypothetical protein
MSETPLKFPDLPADHPANAIDATAEAPQPQTAPVAPETPPAPTPVPEGGTEAPSAPGDTGAREPSAPVSAGADTEPAPAPTVEGQPAAPSGVAFDGSVYRARSDNDVLTNTFCKVIAGPYAGRYGVYITTASLGADGWPDQVVVRTRDAEDENIVVAYADIRPDVAGRR